MVTAIFGSLDYLDPPFPEEEKYSEEKYDSENDERWEKTEYENANPAENLDLPTEIYTDQVEDTEFSPAENQSPTESRICGETLCEDLQVGDIFAAEIVPKTQQLPLKNRDEWELYECTSVMRVHYGSFRYNKKTGVVTNFQKVVGGRRLVRLRPGGKHFRKIKDKNDPLYEVDVVASSVRAIKLELSPTVQYNVSKRSVRKTQIAMVEKRKKNESFVLAPGECERIESIIAELQFLKAREAEEKAKAECSYTRKRKSEQLSGYCTDENKNSSNNQTATEDSLLLDSLQDLFVGSQASKVDDEKLVAVLSDTDLFEASNPAEEYEFKEEDTHEKKPGKAKKARLKA